MKLSQKEIRHTKRVIRVLRDAKEKLLVLTNAASVTGVFPKTTLKAYVEVSEALSHAEVRIAVEDANAI